MLDPPNRPLDGQTPICFTPSPARTLGVEVELSLVDPETGLLVPKAEALLDAVSDDANVKHELFQTIVEVNTGVCNKVSEARADLAARFARVGAAARELGAELICTGTHPISTWRDLPITNDARYERLVERMQWPARRLLICGIHVHVGVPSGEHAIAITNALSCFIPHFLALSASSPYWQSRDTGLASCRSKIFEGMPTAGLPPQVTNWAEFVTLMRTLIAAETITSVREIWWDVRPHPDFGTIELRMCDGVNTLSEICAIAAFAQCMVDYLVERYDEGVPLPSLKRWTLAENRWRAARFADEGQMVRNEQGDQVSLRDHLQGWLEVLKPTAEKLGCASELADVHQIIEHGPGYKRQRAAFAETGSYPEVVRALIQEFQADAPWRR